MTPLTIFLLKLLAGGFASLVVAGAVKGLLWLREVKTNHLPHLQTAMEAIPYALEKQTTTIVKAIDESKDATNELRSDIRALTVRL